MNIVFTMAGKYTRFRLFGAKVPKYLLPLGSGTILSKIIEETKKSSKSANLYFIANRDDQLFYPILQSVLKQYEIPIKNIIYIDDTLSQLETAMFATELIDKTRYIKPICFVNIDTIITNRTLFFEKLKVCKKNTGLIDTFNGRSSKYSFVHTTQNDDVIEVVDNNVISKIACSGLYGFGSFSEMKQATSKLLGDKGTANFTDLYNYYIESKYSVVQVHSPNLNNTIVLGTPEEYLTSIHKFVI